MQQMTKDPVHGSLSVCLSHAVPSSHQLQPSRPRGKTALCGLQCTVGEVLIISYMERQCILPKDECGLS